MNEILSHIEELIPEDAEDFVLAPDSFTEREKRYCEALMAIYRVAHAHNTESSCYGVHKDWRMKK